MVSPYPSSPGFGAALPVAQTAQPDFFQRQGFGGGFPEFASGLRGITRGLAAGFARDPRVREAAALAQAQADQEQQATRRQRIEQSFEIMKQLAAAAQASGGKSPAVMQLIQKQGAIIGELARDPNYGQQLADAASQWAQMPAGQESFTLSPGQTRYGPTGEPLASVPETPPGPVSLGEGGALVDPTTGKIIASRPHAPQQPRQPTSLETYREWLNSPDPELRQAAKIGLQLEAQTNRSEPFTLGEGQTRYDAAGNVIAQGPATTKTWSLSPGQVVVDQTGSIIARGPEKPEEAKTYTLSPGQVVTDATGNVIARGPEQQPEVQTQSIYDPNSPTGITIVPKAEAVGKPGVPPAQATAMENKADKEFQDKQVAVEQFRGQASRIKSKLASGTTVGATGFLERTIAGIGAQAKQLGEAFHADTSLLDPSKYDIPSTGAGASAALKSDILGLAYSIAIAQNGARVTEKDIQNALSQIGGNGVLDDPRQIAAALDSVQQILDMNLQIEASVRGRALPVAPGEQSLPIVKNDADYNALPSGAIFIDPKGKKRRKP